MAENEPQRSPSVTRCLSVSKQGRWKCCLLSVESCGGVHGPGIAGVSKSDSVDF